MLNKNIEKVEEKVGVVVAFVKNITPLLLIWRRRRIPIRKNNLFFKKKVGEKLFYYFFASDKDDNCYKLCFDTEKMEWKLEEVTF